MNWKLLLLLSQLPAMTYTTVNRPTRQQLTQCFYSPHVCVCVCADRPERLRCHSRSGRHLLSTSSPFDREAPRVGVLVPYCDFWVATIWFLAEESEA